MTPEEITRRGLSGGLPPTVRCEADHHGVMLRVPPEHWLAALAFARDCLDCDFFDWLTGVDEAGEGLSVVVHVYSLAGRHHVLASTLLPRSAPWLPTATGIYRGAAWHERETYEMFGVQFRRPSAPGAAAAPGRVRGSSAAQGLCAGGPGGQGVAGREGAR